MVIVGNVKLDLEKKKRSAKIIDQWQTVFYCVNIAIMLLVSDLPAATDNGEC